MSKIIELYLDRVLAVAELPQESAKEIRAELGDHLRSEYESQRRNGASDEDAALAAIGKMGHPELVGRRVCRPFQWIDIRSQGTAKGVIAFGPKAVGVFAFGGIACGVVSIGGVSIGLVPLGGLAIGGLAYGGLAMGLIACGGMSVGVLAMGGMAIGLVASGSTVYALSVIGKSMAGAALYSATDVPGWLQSLTSFMKVPRWIMGNMALVMIVYNTAVAACGVTYWWLLRRRQKATRDWLFG